ncbi:MAG: sigma-70 family RNA polymerase sigma factor [Mycobacterium sp.]
MSAVNRVRLQLFSTALPDTCSIAEGISRLRGDRFLREAMPHNDHLLRHAWRLTGQRVDAEDLLQETMLKAFLAFDKFNEGSSLRSWLSQIMVNTWVDRYRTAQRRPVEQLSGDITDEQLVGQAIHSDGDLRSAETEALKLIPGEAVLALSTLPVDLQTTIYYADIEGYRNTEISEILGIPVGTVASRLHRGRTRLRELLGEQRRCG